MSPSTLNPVLAGLPPPIGAQIGAASKASKVTLIKRKQSLPPLQAKETEQTTSLAGATSRREMMQLAAASAGLLSLVLPPAAAAAVAVAAARPRNATMRQKIMEKFEELRRKAGMSKPEVEREESKTRDEEKKTSGESIEKSPKPKVENEESKPKNGGEEKKGPDGETDIIKGKAMETTLP